MDKPSFALIPVITNYSKRWTITFTYCIEHTVLDDVYDNYDNVLTWLTEVYKIYYEKYSSQPHISRAIRRVDVTKLASDLLASVAVEGTTGCIFLSVVINNDENTNEHVEKNFFALEHIQHMVQWLEGPPKINEVTSIGFTLNHFHELKKDLMVDQLIFDTRVLQKEASASLTFFETVINELKPYFSHLKKTAEEVHASHKEIDFDQVSDDLVTLLQSIYNKRIDDHSYAERDVVSLLTVFIPVSDTTSHMSVHIKMSSETTSTVDTLPTDPAYKSTPGEQNVFVHSYNKMRQDQEPVKKLTPEELSALLTVNGNDSGSLESYNIN